MNDATDRATLTGSRMRDQCRAESQVWERRRHTGNAVTQKRAEPCTLSRQAKNECADSSPDSPKRRSTVASPAGLRSKRAHAFKHIMIPADEGPGSRRAFEYGVELAGRFGARITGFHAMPGFAGWVSLTEQLDHPPKRPLPDAEARVERVFAPLRHLCKQAGVHCETVSEPAENPAEAIIAAAKKLKCDLIVMASHGRVGITRLMLGSETRNVLDHGDLPVLVVR